ncbi:hypothetical protein [Saccharopolyspora sp. NPDC050642]|uniref:hypothetical protein n=1 Tax=Saccharopolyspora sp. NPDC050642 TaxID=3157099 RepID=UPI0033C49132
MSKEDNQTARKNQQEPKADADVEVEVEVEVESSPDGEATDVRRDTSSRTRGKPTSTELTRIVTAEGGTNCHSRGPHKPSQPEADNKNNTAGG